MLAKQKSRNALALLRQSARAAWHNRWWGLLSVAAQDALAASLSESVVRVLEGHDGIEPPIGDVLLDA